MKFLAVLQDSLREIIDTKVFYVMIVLSLLITGVTATLTFTPEPAGKQIMQVAAASMAVDNLEELKDADPIRILQVLGKSKGIYEVVKQEPVDGAPDAPSSSFRVLVRVLPLEAGVPGKQRGTEEEAALFRERFGAMGTFRILNVQDVRRVRKPEEVESRGKGEAFYEVLTRPTSTTYRLWPHKWSLFFGGFQPTEAAAPLGAQLFLIEQVLVGWIGASIAMLVSVVITAFFIPNMLRKGTVDLLLVKPIHRSTLLLYKYLGGLLFMMLNTAVAVVGVWLALGLRSGIWALSIFWMIPILTFSFALLYAISTFFGVLTRSAIVAILMTCLAWGILWGVSSIHFVLQTQKKNEQRRLERQQKKQEPRDTPEAQPSSEHWFPRLISAVHYVLPRRGDLDTLTTQLLVRDLLTDNQIKAEQLDTTKVSWGESVGITCAWLALFLGVSCWWFSTKDY